MFGTEISWSKVSEKVDKAGENLSYKIVDTRNLYIIQGKLAERGGIIYEISDLALSYLFKIFKVPLPFYNLVGEFDQEAADTMVNVVIRNLEENAKVKIRIQDGLVVSVYKPETKILSNKQVLVEFQKCFQGMRNKVVGFNVTNGTMLIKILLKDTTAVDMSGNGADNLISGIYLKHSEIEDSTITTCPIIFRTKDGTTIIDPSPFGAGYMTTQTPSRPVLSRLFEQAVSKVYCNNQRLFNKALHSKNIKLDHQYVAFTEVLKMLKLTKEQKECAKETYETVKPNNIWETINVLSLSLLTVETPERYILEERCGKLLYKSKLFWETAVTKQEK